MTNCPYGFRIVGGTWEARRLVDAAAALAGYAACDDRAEVHQEAYLSAFCFGEDFRRLLHETGSTAGFSGRCWSPWVWFDLDAEEISYAHADAGALAAFLGERFGVDPAELLLFFSGSKGFHIGLPTGLWLPEPSTTFHRTARRFAEALAEAAAVTIDAGVYDRVRAFRAPNSQHAKTGLHKRRLTFDELLGPLAKILALAKTPAPFTIPTCSTTSEQARLDWKAAGDQVAIESEAKAARRAAAGSSSVLNRATRDFIRDGARTGDRHRLLFSAAANLAEFGCPPALAMALLEEPALDSGLPPKDIRRQIECGLAAVPLAPPATATQQDGPGSAPAGEDASILKEPSEAATSDSGGAGGKSCQQVTGTTGSEPAVELQSALARLWASSPAVPPAAVANARSAAPDPQVDLRPLPVPLPAGAVGSGRLDKPCRCGSTEYVEMPISEGRTGRDCRRCGRFITWGRWYDRGGPSQ